MMNKPPVDVPKGESVPPAKAPREDRRVRRTKHALGSALVELMTAEDFDAITVHCVIEKAKVGRTTFYAHFKSTDDLLLSDAERFFTVLAEYFERPGVAGNRVAKLIARRITLLTPDPCALSVPIPVASRMYAGALVELVRWSLDRDETHSPAWVDARYHEVVWLGLRGVRS